MNGFEYQAAGHMIWEGMLTEGLAVTRAVHDRYHASRRNPFNEIECGDHYVRSMASYGVFLAVCGYEYHGPRGHLAFAPRLTPEKFKAPFTVAVGWGTYEQVQAAQQQGHRLELKHGELRLKTVSVELAAGAKLTGVKARVDRKAVPAKATQKGSRVEVSLGGELKLKEGAVLEWECLLA